jgi:UDP-N-acetylmuramoyl-tripeptide--D-alanyl-D-alanine ligase
MKLTLLELLEATGGGEIGGTQVGNTFGTYHTDSREVLPGGVFFALRGASMDGHRFIADALSRGAAALVVERRSELSHGVVEIIVPNTWDALYAVAGYVRERVDPLVVGVTGSNGKTSTKEMVAAILERKYSVLRTTGNLNTETGVPLTILKLEPEHEALVLEMGMQHAGDIARLAQLAEPTVGIITNIGSVHMEFFSSQEQLARGKGELVAALPESGLAVLNADDPFFSLLSELSAAPVTSFGFGAGDLRGESYVAGDDGGCTFTVGDASVHLALEGRHQARNALAALAVGVFAGVGLEEGAAALANVFVAHRLQDHKTSKGVVIVDDAYNASPESMLAAFETMAERPRWGSRRAPRQGKLFAVLGQMGELGSLAVDSHQRVGRRAAEVFDAVAVLDSELGGVLADAAGAHLVPDREAAVMWVKNNARRGDSVLVKGSRSTGLEEVVKELTK